MDDLVARCKHQMAGFRIRELKAVLARLGLPKQGTKQVLTDKILGVLIPQESCGTTSIGLRSEKSLSKKPMVTKEEATKVIDDIYRKLRTSGAVDLASSRNNDGSRSCSLAVSADEDEDTAWNKARICCPCGNCEQKGILLKCQCGVSQHRDCVVFPENLADTASYMPGPFVCDICRVDNGDPFCVTLAQPLLPTKLNLCLTKDESSNPLQSIEKTFFLTQTDRELLHQPNHDLQVWCILLNDKVPFRMHWPANAELHINGVSLRVCNRPPHQLLGFNGRDEGLGVSVCTREGTNRLAFSACDARPFCVGIRIIRRRTVQQIISLIPSLPEGEMIEEALARVRHCCNGSSSQAMDDDEDDGELEVIADRVTLNLRCPISGSRIKIAGRFKPCVHMGCFDLRTFIELNQRVRKWQCPICLKNYTIGDLIMDPLFSHIIAALKTYGEDITEVEMKENGIWRPKLEGEAGAREPWRLPDGSLENEGKLNDQVSSLSVEEQQNSQKQRKGHNASMKRNLQNAKRVSNLGIRAPPQKKINPASRSHHFITTDCTEANSRDNCGAIQETATECYFSSTFGTLSVVENLSESVCRPLLENVAESGIEINALMPVYQKGTEYHLSTSLQESLPFLLNQGDPNRLLGVETLTHGPLIVRNTNSRPYDPEGFCQDLVPGQLASSLDVAMNSNGSRFVSEIVKNSEATIPKHFSSGMYDFFSNNASISSLLCSSEGHATSGLHSQSRPSPVKSDALMNIASVVEVHTHSEFSETHPTSEFQNGEQSATELPILGFPLKYLFPNYPVNVTPEPIITNCNVVNEEMDAGWISLGLGIGDSYQNCPEK